MMLLAATLLAICAPGPRDNCVVDGDTVWIAGEKIRLAEIDTPEISQPRCASELALGLRARDRLLELLNAGEVRIERRGVDRYRRTLARVTAGGVDVGRVLIAEGLAREWDGARRSWC